MSVIKWIKHVYFHFAWGGQKLNFLGKVQRGTGCSIPFSHFSQDSTENQSIHSMGTKGGFTGCCPLSKQNIMSRLQRGFIFSLLQLLSQLLFCQPEILQESREPLSDNRADNTHSCKYFTQTFHYCLMSTVLLEHLCANCLTLKTFSLEWPSPLWCSKTPPLFPLHASTAGLSVSNTWEICTNNKNTNNVVIFFFIVEAQSNTGFLTSPTKQCQLCTNLLNYFILELQPWLSLFNCTLMTNEGRNQQLCWRCLWKQWTKKTLKHPELSVLWPRVLEVHSWTCSDWSCLRLSPAAEPSAVT